MIMIDHCNCSNWTIAISYYSIVNIYCFFSSCNLFSKYLKWCTLRILFFWQDRAGTHYQIYHPQPNDCAFFVVGLSNLCPQYPSSSAPRTQQPIPHNYHPSSFARFHAFANSICRVWSSWAHHWSSNKGMAAYLIYFQDHLYFRLWENLFFVSSSVIFSIFYICKEV